MFRSGRHDSDQADRTRFAIVCETGDAGRRGRTQPLQWSSFWVVICGRLCARASRVQGSPNPVPWILPDEWTAPRHGRLRRGDDPALHRGSPLQGGESSDAFVACGTVKRRLRICWMGDIRQLSAQEARKQVMVALADRRNCISRRGCRILVRALRAVLVDSHR